MLQTDMGALLKTQRIARGMTQRQLGDFVGVSGQQISRYESGSNVISSVMLQTLARALDVSPMFFLADNETVRSQGWLAANSGADNSAPKRPDR
jgi:transcriptional regulator with XRE-family HTH domain